MSPKTRLTAAAASDSPNDSSNACITRGLVMMRANRSGEISAVLRNKAASGMSTISDSHSKVVPSVTPNPGITRCGRRRSIARLTESSLRHWP